MRSLGVLVHTLYFVITIFPLINAQSQFIPVLHPVCPFTGALFTTIPKHQAMTRCVLNEQTSCCDPSYEDLISNATDIFSGFLSSFLSDISATCRNEFTALFCSPCQPDGAVWASQLSSTQYRLVLCTSYCNRLLSSCSDAIVTSTGMPVSERYPVPELFCSDFLGPNVTVNVRPDIEHACFEPVVRDCTADDVTYSYSDCVGGKRDLIYGWRVGVNCTGGVALPTSVSDIDCPVECPKGSYLPLGSSSCAQCPPGTFSLGGGHRVQKWDTWPIRFIVFNTYCTTNKGTRLPASECAGWLLNGTYTQSGISGKPSTTSVLETTVELKAAGTVSFLIKIDSEYGFDKFFFELDGNSTWIKNSGEPKLVSFNVSAGVHTMRWKYAKDFSIDRGQDIVQIYMIEITSLSSTSDYCIDCIPGTTSIAGAGDCAKCPFNTFNNVSASPTCTPCAADKYSFSGDVTCTPRQPCTTANMRFLYTDCDASLTRTKYWKWTDPVICLPTADTPLPANETGLDCSPCNPGTYRSGVTCLPCPPGEWSPVGSSSCQPCGIGSYAPKSIDFQSMWGSFPKNSTSWCDGDCGTEGWRVFDDFIDSGLGHGSQVLVYFRMTVNVITIPFGHFSFAYRMECSTPTSCYIEVYDNSKYIFSTWVGSSNSSFTTVGPFKLEPGIHNLTWSFGKFFSSRNSDRAIIQTLKIAGVSEGAGAGECVVCPAGTANNAPRVSECPVCAPGTYSNSNATTCSPCPENTYTDKPQSAECKPCGHGTHTLPGAASCSTNNCTYQPPGTTVRYDLSALSRTDTMWGPVTDNLDNHFYYVNLCSKTVANPVCLTENRTALNTFACQQFVPISSQDPAIDIGNIIGYYPHPDGLDRGLIVEFTNGTPGCGEQFLNRPHIPRSLNLTIECDPSAGIGKPAVPPQGVIYNGTEYPDVCHYALLWRSIYGCPVCTEKDYEEIPGVCKSGKQTFVYHWKTNPPSCSGGVKLPASRVINCTSTVTCPTGTRLTPESECVACNQGEYSLGNGEVYTNWQEADGIAPFTTSCINCTGGWLIAEGSLQSGPNGTTVLSLEKNFQSGLDSSIDFTYKLVGQDILFRFFIDSVVKLEVNSSKPGYQVFRANVAVGSHSFRWEFAHKPPTFQGQRDSFLRIREIRVRGSVAAVDTCTPCAAGEVSNDDKGGCHSCPVNTAATNFRCEACPADTARLVGQRSCVPRLACADDDFRQTVTDVDSVRCGMPANQYVTGYYYRPPQICQGALPSTRTVNSCIPCPKGTRFDTSTSSCKPCPPGQVLTSSSTCRAMTSGSGPIRSAMYFHSGNLLTSMPAEFKSECFGTCSSTWIANNVSVDSGVNYGEVDVLLTFTYKSVDVLPGFAPPNITFTVVLHPTLVNDVDSSSKRGIQQIVIDAGVEVLIDGVLQDMPFYLAVGVPVTKTFPLPHNSVGEEHTVTWVYSQSAISQPAKITLSDVTVLGTELGAIVADYPCPPGTYSSPELNACTPCTAGYYATDSGSTSCKKCDSSSVSDVGSASCTKCGAGTMVVANKCFTNCRFNGVKDTQIDQFDLSRMPSSYRYTASAKSSDGNITAIYQLNPCIQIEPENCDAGCAPGYVFGELDLTAGHPYNLGNYLSYIPDPAYADKVTELSSTSPIHTFDLAFTGGTNLPKQCTSVFTLIRFYCSLSDGEGFPVPDHTANPCSTTFNWRTAYACPVCRDDDVVSEWSACVQGSQKPNIIYQRICYDAESLSRSAKTQACSDIVLDRTFAIVGLVSLVLVLTIGASVAIYCWHTKREIEIKYAALRTDMNLDSDDDDFLDNRRDNHQIGIDGEDSDDKKDDDDDGTTFTMGGVKQGDIELEDDYH